MASLTPVVTRIIATGTSGQRDSVITQIGELPFSYVTHTQFASSAWKQFSEAVPTSILDYAWDLEGALSIAATKTDSAIEVLWETLPAGVYDYLNSVYIYNGDPETETTFSTHWRQVQATASSTAPQTPLSTIATDSPSTACDVKHQSNQDKLLTLAIALPICLATVFLVLGLLVWWKRHRIVQDLHRKYFSPDFYHHSKASSGDNTPSANTPMSDLPIRVCATPDTQHFQHTGSGRRTPDNPLRSLGTPNFPGPRQHLMEKTRCITPDTPSGRREQLESRAQLIQEVHQRARGGSTTPDLLDHKARRVVSLDRVNEERTELERPSSPTGSIRMVEAAHVPRRAASDAIRTTLDEVFQPQWSPVTSREPST